MVLSIVLTLLVSDTTHVVIYTELGPISVELYEIQAPVTVENFLHYVRSGSYDGGSFFRVVRDDNQPNNPVKITVIQGGASEVSAVERSAIALERTSFTGITHGNGTISMARSGPDTATHSFFVTIGDQFELDFGGRRNHDGQGFAAFGKVTDGMDVVRRINIAAANGQSLDPTVVIDSARVAGSDG